jgi:hypothetical protein
MKVDSAETVELRRRIADSLRDAVCDNPEWFSEDLAGSIFKESLMVDSLAGRLSKSLAPLLLRKPPQPPAHLGGPLVSFDSGSSAAYSGVKCIHGIDTFYGSCPACVEMIRALDLENRKVSKDG